MVTAKQNQKFSFPFFAGSPHTPRRKSKKRRKIFGFVPRPKRADEARLVLGILLEIHSNFVQYTLVKYIRFARYFSVREGFEPSIRKLTRITG